MVEMVRLWLVEVDRPDPATGELEAVLDHHERARADGLRDPVARRRFVAAHAAVRFVLGDLLGAAPGTLRWRRGRNGRPELAGEGPSVNLSHSGGLALIAVAPRRPVGVDIQEVGPHLDGARLAERWFLPPEAWSVARAGGPDRRREAFVRLWVRKEACLKAAGARLGQGLRLPVAGSGRQVVVHCGGWPRPYRVRDVTAPRGFRAAVALAGEDPYRIVRHRWPARNGPGHLPSSVRPVRDRNTSSRVGR